MSEQKDILRETVTRLFGDLVTRDCLIAAEDGGFADALWTALEENGLTLALTPEDKGGVGASWDEVFVIMHAAGKFAVPAPLVETLLARWLLAQAGLEAPDGPLSVAHHLQTENLVARREGDGWRVSGTLRDVPWGRHATHVAALAEIDEKPHLALLPVAESIVAADLNIAREPRDTLTFDGAPAAVADPLAISGDSIFIYGAMARSAQMAGACEKALAEAVQYAQDRVQFGRPIGKFQAVQHQLAALAAKSAQATIAAAGAFRAADRRTPTFEAACAKVIAGEAAGLATTVAHQVHGAIGFTYEHARHFTTRRLWSWRPEFGTETQWAAELGRRTSERGAGTLWRDLTERQSGRGGGSPR
jgi:acyl-CoA dehydrogenase